MAIFNRYVTLPEGLFPKSFDDSFVDSNQHLAVAIILRPTHEAITNFIPEFTRCAT